MDIPQEVKTIYLAIRKGDFTSVTNYLESSSTEAKEFLLNCTDKESKRTALHWSAKQGDSLMTELLLKHGANVNAKDILNITPLMLSAKYGHEECTRVLIKAGADLEVVGYYNGVTAIHTAAENNHAGCITLLAKSGANVNISDKGRTMPLHWAAAYGNSELTKLLVEKGANPYARAAKFRRFLSGLPINCTVDSKTAVVLLEAMLSAEKEKLKKQEQDSSIDV